MRTDQLLARIGAPNQAFGRSRGGPATKIHALCEQFGRLYALLLTCSQVYEIWAARGLLASVATSARFLSDKAYDTDDIRDYLAAEGSEVVIPPKADRKVPKPRDTIVYKMRDIIERSSNRLKDWRGIATRYDKSAASFLAGVCLVSAITYWVHESTP